MRKRALTVSLIAASTLVAATLAAPAASAAKPAPKPIPSTKPTWLGQASSLGAASVAAAVQAKVYLAPRGGLDALKAEAVAVATPGNAQHGKFLTTAQYQARYAPTAATVASVRAWLKSSGLKVTGVEAHNRYVSVAGTVAQAQRAFGTKLNRYNHAGQVVTAPSSAVVVPASLAASVLTVSGLDTSVHKAKPADIPPPDSFQNAHPCSRYYGQIQAKYKADFKTPLPKFNGQTLPYAICGYTGPFFRAAYEGANLTNLDGSGVTVGIVDAYASPTIRKDANKYAGLHGDGNYGSSQFSQWNAAAFTDVDLCGASGWFGEETLDVEAVHAMAPGATIRYYGAASCFDNDLMAALQRVVDENRVQLVTNSWGDVEANASADLVVAYEQIFLQGAVQGISFMFSSGDNGDELANTGIRQADYPTSDPYVTSVGGTSTAIDGSGTLAGETGWGTHKYSLPANTWTPLGFLYGAGGGASSLFNKPAYQTGAGVPGSYRQVPDVAMDGDPTTGMLIGETQTFPNGVHYGEYRIGGTSLSSPLFAGMTALSLQNAGTAAGLLNPAVYANRATAFNDVSGPAFDVGNVRVDYANGNDASNGLLYSVRTFNQDSSLKVTTGWDSVTGAGSPNPGWFDAFSPTN